MARTIRSAVRTFAKPASASIGGRSPGPDGLEEALDLHDDRLGVVDHQGLDVDQLVPLEVGQVRALAELLADLLHLDLVGACGG